MDLTLTRYLQYQLRGDHQKHLGHNLDFEVFRGGYNHPYLLIQTNIGCGDQTSLRSRSPFPTLKY